MRSGEWRASPVQVLEAATAGAPGRCPEPTRRAKQGPAAGPEAEGLVCPPSGCRATAGVPPGRAASSPFLSASRRFSGYKLPFSTQDGQRRSLLQLRVLTLGWVHLRSGERREEGA